MLAHPLSGAWMSPYTSDEIPTIERTAPTGSSWPCSGSRDLGTRNQPATSASAMIGTFTRNTDPYQKWPSSHPLATGPIAPAAPVVAAQIAMALVRSSGGNTFTRIDNVDGMINAADAPIAARQAMSCHISRGLGRERGGDEEADEPELQRALAPEPVADRAGGEEQAGEHERVGGDDPLELRLGGVQVAGERRDRDVEARVADEDDEQAEAEDRERPPAAGVGGARRRSARARRRGRAGASAVVVMK